MDSDADFELERRPMDIYRVERTERATGAPIRSHIINYLASHGASNMADISTGNASLRGSVR